MKGIGSGLQQMVGFGAASSPDNQPSADFEDLALPLFDSLYNFCCWLVHDQNDSEDLVQMEQKRNPPDPRSSTGSPPLPDQPISSLENWNQ